MSNNARRKMDSFTEACRREELPLRKMYIFKKVSENMNYIEDHCIEETEMTMQRLARMQEDANVFIKKVQTKHHEDFKEMMRRFEESLSVERVARLRKRKQELLKESHKDQMKLAKYKKEVEAEFKRMCMKKPELQNTQKTRKVDTLHLVNKAYMEK